MKHTPGPWKVDVSKDVWGNDEFDIMDSGGYTLLTGFVHRKDDALLMAAAPELLQALADIQECCNGYVGTGPLKTINEIASDAIRVVWEQQGRIEKLETPVKNIPTEDHQVTEWQVYNPTDGNLLAKGTDKFKVLASLPLDTEYVIIKYRISY